ncbi:hypothetical protein [Streptomyces achromogenes]|uniref:DUF7848 domain-containing protein n=1 Tax=Streptomyces achromogenes TaxID=67255 RepID=UPI0036801330
MSRRSLFKHVRWIFKLMLDEPILYSAKCKICGLEPAQPLKDPFEAENWTRLHAARPDREGRHHTSFHMIQMSSASLAPDPDDLARVSPGWKLLIAE